MKTELTVDRRGSNQVKVSELEPGNWFYDDDDDLCVLTGEKDGCGDRECVLVARGRGEVYGVPASALVTFVPHVTISVGGN